MSQDKVLQKSKPQSVSGDELLLCIAVLAGLLPFALLFSVQFFFTWDAQQPSMSDYVYTTARSIFYGIVFTLGMVLLFYRGYPKNDGPIPIKDDHLASIAGLGAIIVALFPTNHCLGVDVEPFNAYNNLVWGKVHLFGAFVSYASMAVFFFFYFTQTGGRDERHLAWNKRIRNRIYKACGWTIVFCMMYLIARGGYNTVKGIEKCVNFNQLSYVFWAEMVMQIAIATAWGTKYAGRKISH